MSDYNEIYLEPECCAESDIGRVWCEHNAPTDCEDGVEWTKYIRADLATPQRWIPVGERLPDQDSPHRVESYTPDQSDKMEFRLVSASLFKTAMTEATHWRYILPPTGE